MTTLVSLTLSPPPLCHVVLPYVCVLCVLSPSEELSGMLGALEGGWVAPEAGGDLLRDGPGVLPTGEGEGREVP